MDEDVKWLPDKCIAQKKVSSLSSWLRHVFIFLTASSICTHSHLPRSRKNRERKDKSEREKKGDFWMLPCSLSHAFVFQSTFPRTSRSLSLSSTGFYVHWQCLHDVCCIPSAKETKCGFIKTDCFQWLCFTFLCFLHIQFWFNWLWLNFWIKKHFHRIKEGEIGNNYMVSQHLTTKWVCSYCET